MSNTERRVGVFCVPFYSHVTGVRDSLRSLVSSQDHLVICVHQKFFELFIPLRREYVGFTLMHVDRMVGKGWKGTYGKNGLGYIADALKAQYRYYEPCLTLMDSLELDFVITDSVTRRPVMAAQCLEIPYTTRSSLYPLTYQKRHIDLIKRQLVRNIFVQPRAIPAMARRITKIIMTYKPTHRAQAEHWFYDDSAIQHWTGLPEYFFEDTYVEPNLHSGYVPNEYDTSLTKQALIEAGCPWSAQQLLANEKVVYCALGSLIGISEEGKKVLEGLATQGWKVLCSSGVGGREGIHNGVWYAPFMPQRACLDVAKLFVTHAGPKSIVEAREQNVPMIMFPHLEDQFLYAHRMEELDVGKVVKSWEEVKLTIESA